jgi:hypothetical protein
MLSLYIYLFYVIVLSINHWSNINNISIYIKFSVSVRFRNSVYPLPFPFSTILDSIPFSMIKCGYRNGREVFPSVSIPSYAMLIAKASVGMFTWRAHFWCREQATSPRIITTRGRAGNFSNRSTRQIRK